MGDISESILLSTADDNRRMGGFHCIYTGLVAGAVAQTITSPIRPFSQIKEICSNSAYGLWRGNLSMSVLSSMQTSIKFFLEFELGKKFENIGCLTWWQRLAIGTAAGSISRAIPYPFETVTRRLLACKDEEIPSIHSKFAELLQNDGLLKSYSGVFHSIIQSGLCTGIDFTLAGTLSRYLSRYMKVGPAKLSAISTLTDAIGYSLTYPLTQPNLIETLKKQGVAYAYKGFEINFCRRLPYTFIQNLLIQESRVVVEGLRRRTISRRSRRPELPPPPPEQPKRIPLRAKRRYWF